MPDDSFLTDLAASWCAARITDSKGAGPKVLAVDLEPSIGPALKLVFSPVGVLLQHGPNSNSTWLDVPDTMAPGLSLDDLARGILDHAFGPTAQRRWRLVQDIAVLRAQDADWTDQPLYWLMKDRHVVLTSGNPLDGHLLVCTRNDALFQGLRVPFGTIEAPLVGPTQISLRAAPDSRHARMERLARVMDQAVALNIDVQPFLDAHLIRA